jgi:hypothetical protein
LTQTTIFIGDAYLPALGHHICLQPAKGRGECAMAGPACFITSYY